MPRIRLTFGRNEALRYVSHLDMMRMWERILRRADIPLAYSEGFNPHPKISTACPLAVGVISICEILDLQLESDMPVDELLQRIASQLPAGLRILSAEEVEGNPSSLAAALRFAEYEVGFDLDPDRGELEDRINSALSSETLPRERVKEGRVKQYDLRPLIDGLELVEDADHRLRLWMRLQSNSNGAGRPEEVASALGIDAPLASVKRVRLEFGETRQ